MLRHFRSEDVVGRWGGEEFVVALYGCSLSQAAARLELLRNEVGEKTFSVDQASAVRITLSAGVVAFPEAGADLERLCHAADTALYLAKRSGRNRVVFTPSATANEPSTPPAADGVWVNQLLWQIPERRG